jgi:serine/threonine protein kinase
LDTAEDKKDLWLIYEVCEGKSLNEGMFEVKGEFFKGERIYMVNHSNFYHALRNSIELARSFIQKIAQVLNHFANLGIVHADLKSDNILVDYDENSNTIKSLKVIDFGSAFILSEDGRSLKD